MANWLERARRELSDTADGVAAKTAERSPTSVMAVPNPGVPEISLGSIGSNGSAPASIVPESEKGAGLAESDARAVRGWLAHIDETDATTIAEVLERCRTSPDVRAYFICRAAAVPEADERYDDRRRCDQCTNLTDRGHCLAAWRGEILASRNFQPVRDWRRRCEGYLPGPEDTDRRPGRERWFGMTQKGSRDANT